MQDDVKSHYEIQERRIKFPEEPLYSPDLNPIENDVELDEGLDLEVLCGESEL